MQQYLRRLRKRSQGQGVLEFALILMLVGLAAAAIIFILGPTIGNVFSNFIADAPVRAGHLVRVLPQHALPARHVYAVTASRHGVDAKAAAFLAQLQATLAGGLS